MAYTVKKLAEISGVSVRTLHFYDEIGLLKPAYQGGNGYRYYEEEQLLKLQQILFFRELGFQLNDIQKIIDSSNFNKIETLRAHRRILEKNINKTHQLISTIDKTISKLTGDSQMKDEDLYQGFDAAKQEAYEKYLIDRYGKPVEEKIKDSKKRIKDWAPEQFKANANQLDQILKDLQAHFKKKTNASDVSVQTIIQLHYDWVSLFWMPNKESYSGLADLYCDHPDFRKFYDKYDVGLVDYLANAMKIFANQKLAD